QIEAVTDRGHVVGVVEARADLAEAHVRADAQGRVALGRALGDHEATRALIVGGIGPRARLGLVEHQHLTDVLRARAELGREHARAGATAAGSEAATLADMADAPRVVDVPAGDRHLA